MKLKLRCNPAYSNNNWFCKMSDPSNLIPLLYCILNFFFKVLNVCPGLLQRMSFVSDHFLEGKKLEFAEFQPWVTGILFTSTNLLKKKTSWGKNDGRGDSFFQMTIVEFKFANCFNAFYQAKLLGYYWTCNKTCLTPFNRFS